MDLFDTKNTFKIIKNYFFIDLNRINLIFKLKKEYLN